MDAVIELPLRLFFGGEYSESWTADNRLVVRYSGRAFLSAYETENGYRFDAPLPDNPLALDYFTAAADVARAARLCEKFGAPRAAIYEYFRSESPVSPFEMFRLLLDDWGFEFEQAIRLTVRACGAPRRDIDPAPLEKLEPRTAHLVTTLLRALDMRALAVHDSRQEAYRAPLGALETGAPVRLCIADAGGNISGAAVELYGENFKAEYQMQRGDGGFSAHITLPETPAALWYCFRLETPWGLRFLSADGSGFYGTVSDTRGAGFRLTVYKRGYETPAWFSHAIIYQIFPDRFAFTDEDGTARRGIEYHRALGQTPELHESKAEPVRWQARNFEASYAPDDFYGGTLKGIEEKLPYIKSLGANLIYLNPIFEARSNHRYDTSDYHKIDPVLGTNEDFISLAKAAESMGIRLMLDGVFSHTGCDSVYFNREGHYPSVGACQGESSPYFKWYDFKHFPDSYRCWWNFPDLPEVFEENGEWQDFVVTGENSVVKAWLRNGASAWRLDVADELPDSVLELIRESVKAENPEAVILGEVWEDAIVKESYGALRRYALGGALDSVMNYPLRDAVLAFMHERASAYETRDFLDSQRLNYPPPFYRSLMNLMSSHDVERIRTNLATQANLKALAREAQLAICPTEAEWERARRLERLCAAICFALPGAPSIYYGEETGMTGVRDPFNRLPFTENDTQLREFYKMLCTLRRENPVLTDGEAKFAACGEDVLIIERSLGGEKTVTVINRGAAERPVPLSGRGTDLLTGREVQQEYKAPPQSAAMIRIDA